MSWIQLSFDTGHEAVDWVRTLLGSTDYINDVRISGYSDGDVASAGERADEAVPWRYTIEFYLPHDKSTRARLDELVALLSPLQRTGLTSKLQVEEMEHKPAPAAGAVASAHRIGERFVILHPTTPYPPANADEDIVLQIGTTLSFGSGLHPATMLSLQLIERYVERNMETLDLGSGSGILSVAMARLGAHVVALDNDSVAVKATQEAVRQNEVEQHVTVMKGSLGLGHQLGHWMGASSVGNVPALEAAGAFDLIVSNILAHIHVMLADDYQRALRQRHGRGGYLITAGFTADREDDVRTALSEAGFAAIHSERMDEWSALAFQLR